MFGRKKIPSIHNLSHQEKIDLYRSLRRAIKDSMPLPHVKTPSIPTIAGPKFNMRVTRISSEEQSFVFGGPNGDRFNVGAVVKFNNWRNHRPVWHKNTNLPAGEMMTARITEAGITHSVIAYPSHNGYEAYLRCRNIDILNSIVDSVDFDRIFDSKQQGVKFYPLDDRSSIAEDEPSFYYESPFFLKQVAGYRKEYEDQIDAVLNG